MHSSRRIRRCSAGWPCPQTCTAASTLLPERTTNTMTSVINSGLRQLVPRLLPLLAMLGATVAQAGTLTVNPGESIQAAVTRATPGDRIEVLAGSYAETVYVDKDDIVLHGVM